ncbi:DLW-39 family protein [Geodermatophilus sp. SYSU D00815]
MLKKLALAAAVAGAITAIRKRSAGRTEADLWHEATSGPDAVSTPTAR